MMCALSQIGLPIKICYCDESGTGDEPIAVMVGIIVDHTRMHITKRDWCDLLGHFPQTPSAIEHLASLTDDSDDDVRNWSLFALGTQSDFDSPALRDIFIRHLDDPNEDAKQEAIAGLCKRKDPRAALPLLRVTQSGSYFSHQHYDFLAFVDAPEDADRGTDGFIDALYEHFHELLPPREEAVSN